MQNPEMSEILEKWQDYHEISRFEGTSGVKNLEKLLKSLGYSRGNYVGYGNEIINFLSDNPGAIEAILNFIVETNDKNWNESLIEDLPEDCFNESDEEKEE